MRAVRNDLDASARPRWTDLHRGATVESEESAEVPHIGHALPRLRIPRDNRSRIRSPHPSALKAPASARAFTRSREIEDYDYA